MSIASVLIPAELPAGAPANASKPRYSLLLSTDPGLVEAAQRLRHDVFSSTPGFALPAAGTDHIDVDRFDEYCDHLLVRDDDTGALVGCYRMLPPAGTSSGSGTPRRRSTGSARTGRCASTGGRSTTFRRRRGRRFRRSCAATCGWAPRSAASRRTTRTSGWATSACCWTNGRPTP